MSTQHPSSQTPEEMDLTDIFALFKRWIYEILALFFRAFDFIIKFWWIIVLLIVGGALLGYFTKGDPGYKSTMIVKTNLDSQPYVYNAIDQFNSKIKDGDGEFFKAIGKKPGNLGIANVQISPVVDVVNLLEKIEPGNRTLEVVIQELSVDDETELFASDRFYSNYSYHKLEVMLGEDDNKESIELLLSYINNNPVMKTIKDEGYKNLKDHIQKNERSIAQIDSLISNYTNNLSIVGRTAENLAFFNNQNNLNVNGAFTHKGELTAETEILKNQLVTFTDIAVVISNIETVRDEGLMNKKEIIYPVLFVFFFLVLAGLRYAYITLRRKIKAENLLD